MKKCVFVLIFVMIFVGTRCGGSADGVISKSKYDKIELGMSYEEVVEIIGGEGEEVSSEKVFNDPIMKSMEIKEGSGSIITYEYVGEELGETATFTFEDNQLTIKHQSNLK